MPSENRSEYVSIPLIRPKAFQLFTRTAASVIEQDSRESSPSLRAPQRRAQPKRPVVHDHYFRLTRHLAHSSRRDGARQSEGGHHEWARPCHWHLWSIV